MSAVPAAAWFPDPTGAAELRWWDGAAWTEHVHGEPRAAQTQPAPPPASTEPLGPVGSQQVLRDDARWLPWPDAPPGADWTAAPATEAQRRAASRSTKRVVAIGGVVLLAMFSGSVLLAVAAVAAAIVLFLVAYSRQAPVVEQAIVEWAEARGLRYVGGAIAGTALRSPIEPERIVGVARALEVLGHEPRRRECAQLEGRLWRAAPGACRITQVNNTDRGDEDRSCQFLVVEVPLEPATAARYPGLLLTARHWPRGLGSLSLARIDREWRRVEHEASSGSDEVLVHLGPGQDQLAAMELLDPAFLERLRSWFAARDAETWLVFLGGSMFVVSTDDRSLWKAACAHGMRRGTLVSDPDSTDDLDLHRELETIGEVYRRVFAEYQ